MRNVSYIVKFDLNHLLDDEFDFKDEALSWANEHLDQKPVVKAVEVEFDDDRDFAEVVNEETIFDARDIKTEQINKDDLDKLLVDFEADLKNEDTEDSYKSESLNEALDLVAEIKKNPEFAGYKDATINKLINIYLEDVGIIKKYAKPQDVIDWITDPIQVLFDFSENFNGLDAVDIIMQDPRAIQVCRDICDEYGVFEPICDDQQKREPTDEEVVGYLIKEGTSVEDSINLIAERYNSSSYLGESKEPESVISAPGVKCNQKLHYAENGENVSKEDKVITYDADQKKDLKKLVEESSVEQALSEFEAHLEEEAHASKARSELNKTKAYNAALKIAKKKNKPVIYGYHGSDKHGGYRYYEIKPIACNDIKKCTDDIKAKYHTTGSVLVAYPDKSYLKESDTDLNFTDEEIDALATELLNNEDSAEGYLAENSVKAPRHFSRLKEETSKLHRYRLSIPCGVDSDTEWWDYYDIEVEAANEHEAFDKAIANDQDFFSFVMDFERFNPGGSWDKVIIEDLDDECEESLKEELTIEDQKKDFEEFVNSKPDLVKLGGTVKVKEDHGKIKYFIEVERSISGEDLYYALDDNHIHILNADEIVFDEDWLSEQLTADDDELVMHSGSANDKYVFDDFGGRHENTISVAYFDYLPAQRDVAPEEIDYKLTGEFKVISEYYFEPNMSDIEFAEALQKGLEKKHCCK